MTSALRSLGQYVWNHPLNADHRIAALGRVVWWQTVSRLKSGPVALPFVDGTRLLVTRGMSGATGNWYCGLHEVNDMAFVLHVLRPGEHFLDVGANIGSYTVLAAGAVGATVTSVEPVPGTFAHLQRNISQNALLDRVTAWQGGLSDSAGTRLFTVDQDTTNHVVADDASGAALPMPVSTVDALMDGRGPVVIKIDVEGHERHVLCGARQTLADPRLLAVVMEVNCAAPRPDGRAEEITEVMGGFGFSPYAYDPFGRRLFDARDAGAAAPNTIFVRDVAAVNDRVRTSRRYRLVNGQI